LFQSVSRRTALALIGAGFAPVPLGCAQTAPLRSGADAQFEALGRRWLDENLRLNPISATRFGDHRFDSEIDDVSAAGRAAELALTRRTLSALRAVPRAELSRANQVDAAVLENSLRETLFTAETLQSWAWDPLIYNGLAGGALNNLMAREFAPLPVRLRAAAARMEKLPVLLAQTRANLDPARTPRIHAETVAGQNRGLHALVDAQVMPQAAALAGAERERLAAAAAGFKRAVDEHQRWLEGVLVPNARGDFRLGRELYDAKLALALDSPLTRAEIRRRGEAELVRIRSEMYALSRTVLAGRPGVPATPPSPSPAQQQAAIEAALELAYAEKPRREALVETAERMLVQATAFVRERGLVTVPDAPVKVILTPEFQRGVAVAYCDAPGPLDKGESTFYKISPIPDDWTAAQADSFLREYNTRSMQEVTVHEAMPGHYLQLAHSNNYPSVLRAVLSSGTFVEGWAVYAQDIMADAGYLGGEPLYRLIHLKWHLRVIANALLDQGVHVDGMTREAAMELMTRQTFQQEREAAGKWVRAQVSSAQLPTYFVGWEEHKALKAEVQRREGAGFDARRFHDAVLSYGSPPVRYVRAMMLNEPI
jgi:uncharacterized protein (DUF885 family)